MTSLCLGTPLGVAPSHLAALPHVCVAMGGVIRPLAGRVCDSGFLPTYPYLEAYEAIFDAMVAGPNGDVGCGVAGVGTV